MNCSSQAHNPGDAAGSRPSIAVGQVIFQTLPGTNSFATDRQKFSRLRSD
jgi:hypothetical protein